ncbi:MAG: putative metal-dependent hydrolase [Acidobacteriota bacterium]|nr:putative metal-dependent hydrolase [Acidobacteriota bacterium]
MNAENDPRYPIGKFQWPVSVTPDDRAASIEVIANAPVELRTAAAGLTEAQLGTPYREGGWTLREVIHHVPDSHLNSYVRFKLALTENEPTVKPYDEAAWAALPDAVGTPVEVSLALLESLHRRWVVLLRSLSESDWKKKFLHPEIGPVTLESNLALYAWHGRHHAAHVTSLRKRKGW